MSLILSDYNVLALRNSILTKLKHYNIIIIKVIKLALPCLT